MNTRETDFWDDRSGPAIAPEQFKKIVASAADLAILLEVTGKVRSVTVNPLNPSLGRLDHWTDRDIRDFLAEDSLGKLEAQLAAHRSGAADPVDSIEVNHFDTADWEVPIRYTLHNTGQDGVILMLGRDLRPVAELQHRLVNAQLALEKDYETRRDYETRYRVVMEAARDPLALVDANSGRIVDVNSAGAHVLGAKVDDLTGNAFTQEFDGRRRGEFIEALNNGASVKGSGPISAVTRRPGLPVSLHPTLFRAAGERFLLCRIEPAESAEIVAEDLSIAMAGLYGTGPDAIVFCDTHGHIRASNEAFLALCDAGSSADVRGRSLGDFMARGSVDLKVLTETAARSGRMRVYATRIESTYGTQVSVEISATLLEGPGTSGFAFVIRDVSRMDVVREQPGVLSGGTVTNDAMHNVMDLVGSAPLRDIVAATTDVVERMCIETAIKLTNNNRVAAAEMLGLSRQSLYVKLRKFGMLNREPDNDT